MQTEKITLAVTLRAAVALATFRFVDFTGNTCSAGERALGVPRYDCAANEDVAVGARGEMLVEAGAAITPGQEVESDASGRAVPKTTGVSAGEARDTATAAGDYIRVLR